MNAGTQHLSNDEQHSSRAYFDVQESPFGPSDATGYERWWLITGAIVILLWGGYFAGTSALLDLGSSRSKADLYLPRAIVDMAGVLISFAMMYALYSLRDSSLVRRALLAVAMALAATVAQSLINTKIFNAFFPNSSPAFGLTNFAIDFAWRIWIWVSTAGTILAMSYAVDIRERERRILGLQSLAHSAQLRALRFQLNPHFLFNALNSITGLISAKRVKEAETMTENLSDFLRLTLRPRPAGPDHDRRGVAAAEPLPGDRKETLSRSAGRLRRRSARRARSVGAEPDYAATDRKFRQTCNRPEQFRRRARDQCAEAWRPARAHRCGPGRRRSHEFEQERTSRPAQRQRTHRDLLRRARKSPRRSLRWWRI